MVTLFAAFSLLGPFSQASEGSRCEDYITGGLRGGVTLTAEEARLYDIGPRGVLQVIHSERFTAEQKIKLWRAAVQSYREKELFVNDEIWFDYKGQRVVAFVGVSSPKLRTLLFILPSGRVILTHSPSYLETAIERLGGGLQGMSEGTATGVVVPDEFLAEYLGNILSHALGESF